LGCFGETASKQRDVENITPVSFFLWRQEIEKESSQSGTAQGCRDMVVARA
jgi:hypothetical protein